MTPPQSPTPELVEKFAKMRARAASDASSTSSVASSASFERIVTVPPVNEPTDATEAANRPGNVWLKLTPESDDDVTDATASPTRGPPASALRRNSNVDVQPSVAPPPAIVFPTFPPPAMFGGQPQPAIPPHLLQRLIYGQHHHHHQHQPQVLQSVTFAGELFPHHQQQYHQLQQQQQQPFIHHQMMPFHPQQQFSVPIHNPITRQIVF